jgi:hypothetical protein
MTVRRIAPRGNVETSRNVQVTTEDALARRQWHPTWLERGASYSAPLALIVAVAWQLAVATSVTISICWEMSPGRSSAV